MLLPSLKKAFFESANMKYGFFMYVRFGAYDTFEACTNLPRKTESIAGVWDCGYVVFTTIKMSFLLIHFYKIDIKLIM